jgi:hypothetical protein
MIYERGGSILGAGCEASAAPVTWGGFDFADRAQGDFCPEGTTGLGLGF